MQAPHAYTASAQHYMYSTIQDSKRSCARHVLCLRTGAVALLRAVRVRCPLCKHLQPEGTFRAGWPAGGMLCIYTTLAGADTVACLTSL